MVRGGLEMGVMAGTVVMGSLLAVAAGMATGGLVSLEAVGRKALGVRLAVSRALMALQAQTSKVMTGKMPLMVCSVVFDLCELNRE